MVGQERQDPKLRFHRTDQGPGPGPTRELQSRIDCKGKVSGQVLDELSRVLQEARTLNRDPLIVLEDLGLLADSVTTLIKGLCRLLAGYPRTVTFWESTGYAEAFLSVMENPGADDPKK